MAFSPFRLVSASKASDSSVLLATRYTQYPTFSAKLLRFAERIIFPPAAAAPVTRSWTTLVSSPAKMSTSIWLTATSAPDASARLTAPADDTSRTMLSPDPQPGRRSPVLLQAASITAAAQQAIRYNTVFIVSFG
jgi:hypothetical protein